FATGAATPRQGDGSMVQQAIRRCAARAALAGALATMAALPATASGHERGGQSSPVARTQQGVVRGLTAEGADKFLGIPYAARPGGALRWPAPQPPARWHGVRPAIAYGNRCPQLASSNGAGSENEDCLTINVFRPQQGGRKLPVLFWIHGGGFQNG